MAERDIPNSLSPDQAKKPDQKTSFAELTNSAKLVHLLSQLQDIHRSQ